MGINRIYGMGLVAMMLSDDDFEVNEPSSKRARTDVSSRVRAWHRKLGVYTRWIVGYMDLRYVVTTEKPSPWGHTLDRESVPCTMFTRLHSAHVEPALASFGEIIIMMCARGHSPAGLLTVMSYRLDQNAVADPPVCMCRSVRGYFVQVPGSRCTVQGRLIDCGEDKRNRIFSIVID